MAYVACAVILRVTIDLSNLLQRMKKITFGLLSLNINRFLSIQHWYVCWFIKIWHVILWSTRLANQQRSCGAHFFMCKKIQLGVFILWVFMKFYVFFLCRLLFLEVSKSFKTIYPRKRFPKQTGGGKLSDLRMLKSNIPTFPTNGSNGNVTNPYLTFHEILTSCLMGILIVAHV